MLASEIRNRVRGAAHALDDSNRYGDEEVDRAWQTVLDDFMLEVRPVVVSGTVALGTTVSVSLPGTTTFRPDRAIRFELRKHDESADEPGHVIEQRDYNSVARAVRSGTAAATCGQPTSIAFRTPTVAFLDRVPGTTYPDLRFTYFDRLNTRTLGTSLPGTTEVNIPDELVAMPVWFGAVAVLQHTDPASFYQTEAWRRYEEYRERCKRRVHPEGGVQEKDFDQYL